MYKTDTIQFNKSKAPLHCPKTAMLSAPRGYYTNKLSSYQQADGADQMFTMFTILVQCFKLAEADGQCISMYLVKKKKY